MRKRFHCAVLAAVLAAGLALAPVMAGAQSAGLDNAAGLPRLSPWPARVEGVAAPRISLNGIWQFRVQDAGAKDIRVPGEWAMQGFTVDSAGTGRYTRQFSVPEDWKGKRVKLRFDGVSSHCSVRVNGRQVGSHEGSFVPFEFDLSGAVHTGTNTMEVDVACQTLSDILASTSQYAGHPVGGILRKVTLFALPAVNLSDQTYVTRFDDQYRDARLEIPFAVSNEGNGTADAEVSFRLKDDSGRPVSVKQARFSVGRIPGGETRRDTVSFFVSRPKQWNPEMPYLYTLETRLTVGGRLAEIHIQKIGFRQIEVRGSRLFVNNRPVKLHGVCRHSIDPYTGRSVSPRRCVEDALLFREGNCNYIRTSHYPPEEEFLDACDSLGLFVESESSLCWIGHGAAPVWKKWDYKDPRFLPYMMQANLEKMVADRNHPSVILWSLGNESRWSPLWADINRAVKRLDPSRPTVFQDQAWGTYNNAGSRTDIANYHYPDFDGAASTDTIDRPVQFDEFAHVENYNRLEVLTDPYVRVAWGPSLARIYDSMYAHPGCLGGAIWAGIDDIFHMPDHTMIGYGPWGVIDGWRRRKPEFYGMKEAYSPVVVKRAAAPADGGKLRLRLENRYDFLNLSALEITCYEGGRQRPLHVDVPPHGTATVSIPVSGRGKNDPVRIVFRDPRGFVSQEVVIPTGETVPHAPSPGSLAPVKLSESGHDYRIQAGRNTFVVNKATGEIQTAAIAGKAVPVSAPALMIVPLNNDDGGGPGVTNCNYQTELPVLLYQPYRGWKADSVRATREDDGSVSLRVTGAYAGAGGVVVTRFEKDGSLVVQYAFTLTGTDGIDPRQWGLVCTLPRSYDRLSWDLKGPAVRYPAASLARLHGTAVARPADRSNSLRWEKPSEPWASDANKLGTNAFRSTKAGIYRASLTNAEGLGVELLSDGAKSARAWVDGDKVYLLSADYNTGGSDHFSGFFYEEQRRPLKAGSRITGNMHLQLIDDKLNKGL